MEEKGSRRRDNGTAFLLPPPVETFPPIIRPAVRAIPLTVLGESSVQINSLDLSVIVRLHL